MCQSQKKVMNKDSYDCKTFWDRSKRIKSVDDTQLHLSTSHPVVHKASVMCLHFSRLTASFLTSSHEFHPLSSLSFSIILRQVVFALPLFLFPLGAHVRAVTSSLFLSFLSMWPINFHLCLFTSLLNGSISALSNKSSVLTWSYHRTSNIFCRHMFWQTSISLSLLLFTFQVSQPDNNTGTTNVL